MSVAPRRWPEGVPSCAPRGVSRAPICMWGEERMITLPFDGEKDFPRISAGLVPSFFFPYSSQQWFDEPGLLPVPELDFLFPLHSLRTPDHGLLCFDVHPGYAIVKQSCVIGQACRKNAT